MEEILSSLHYQLYKLSPTTVAWTISLLLVSIYLTAGWAYHQLNHRTGSTRSSKDRDSRGKIVNFHGQEGNVGRDEADAQEGEVGVDAVIVGAGVAGSALAYALGKEGRRVLLLERDLTEPDRIVGELLQPGGFLKLIELGLEDCVEGIDAQLVWGYALFKDGNKAEVEYPLEAFKRKGSSGVGISGSSGKEVEVAGRSFHNGRFVQKLRQKAASLPNVTLVQATVTGLVEDGELVKGVKYKQKTKARGEDSLSSEDGTERGAVEECEAEVTVEKEVLAPLTFVCDGCFSKLRRSLSKSKVDSPSNFVGLVLENCVLPVPNFGHVVLADPSPILFYPISSTEVRCLVDIPSTSVPSMSSGAMAAHLTDFVLPQLPEQLKAPFLAAVTSGKIRMMPNKIMPANPITRPGALLMGDAFNMRHPLTGGGMTVALADIALLTNMLNALPNFNDPYAIVNYTEAFYTRRKPVAATINTLACALYKVFCASPDAAMSAMRQACFDYLSLGGIFASGPVALLSGLNPRPLSLVLHFFAVAIYGVGRLLLPFPTPSSIWMGVRLLRGASNIIFPIVFAEGIRKMFFPVTDPSYYLAPARRQNVSK